MKRFMKTCGIIGGISLMAGIVLLVLVAVMKGTSLVGEALDRMEISGIVDSVRKTKTDYPEAAGEVVDGNKMENIDTLVLRLGGCSFSLEESEDQYFYVNQSGADRMEVKKDGTTCYITYKENGYAIQKAPKIRLFVPKGTVFSNAECSFGAGEFDFIFLQADNVTMELGAGEVIIDELSVGNGTFEIGAGSMEVKMAKVQSNLNVECAMGAIDLRLAGEREDYHVNANCSLGDITVGGMHQVSGSTTGGEGASKTINAQCSMGSINIDFE